MTKKIFSVVIIVTLTISLIGCSDSGSQDLSKENEQLQARVKLLEETLIENGISLPEDTVVIEESQSKEDSGIVKAEKFSEVTLEVLGKVNTESNYSDFVVLPYKVINRYDKEIKGIQGTMHIKDMFGEEIMSLGWNIDSIPIPTDGYIEEDGYGLDVNQFMDDHMKLYNTSYENLIFEYEITKVLFSDGTMIE